MHERGVVKSFWKKLPTARVRSPEVTYTDGVSTEGTSKGDFIEKKVCEHHIRQNNSGVVLVIDFYRRVNK